MNMLRELSRFSVVVFIVLGAFVIAPVASAHHSTEQQEREHILGILTYRPQAESSGTWQPLVDYLSAANRQHRLKLKFLNHDEMQQAILDGNLDFVLTNPTHFIALREKHNLTGALATLISYENGIATKSMGGVIITRADRTDIQTLQDLQGRKIAVYSTNSSAFGAYQIQVAELKSAGLPKLRPEQIIANGISQDHVVQAVLQGKADIGFIRTASLK